MENAALKVLIASSERVLFEGNASSVILPGEQGVFEILPHHKAVLSRLLPGKIVLDNHTLPIRRGVVKASLNQVTVIIEEAPVP